ncbi:MAG: outer membrane protein assembly factor BamA [Cellvibrionales bacterium TMED122]|nr:MAG: outer membrane protein assembly factor BamA [Cellvibrionales bacterium TMED122]|tara:strand:- start:73 stop:2304 length:2232 start_codon:yes stop_codon:yes gene_type:complete
MKKIYKYICLFLILFNPLKAENIDEIIINGNKRVSDETIKIYGEINQIKKFSEKNSDRILKNLYETGFFEDVQLVYENNKIIINLKEYPTINQLVIVGEKSNKFREEIKKLINSKQNNSLNKSNLAKDINIIKGLYSSLGYNFASVEAKINKIDEENFDLLFEIERGKKTKISKINFLGNDSVRSKRLKDVIASEESKFWKVISRNTVLSENLINLDKRLLNNYYKSLGFYDVKINSNLAKIINSEQAELIYSIDEGERFLIGKITTNLDNVFDKKIFFPLETVYKKFSGEYYSPFKIKTILDEIDEIISNNNLQFVEHNVQEQINAASIDIIFNIFEGEKKLVERINVKGNTVTNENVIRGEFLIDEGDPFTNINLEKTISKLKARNIFKDVKYETTNGSEDNLKIIDITVEERPTGEISAGAGVGTSGGAIAFGVKENNWLGTGKSVEFQIDADEESLSGIVSISDPNYDFLGNSLNYFLKNESNDKPTQGYENSVISAGIGTSFEQYKNLKASVGTSFSYDDLRTQGNASATLKKQSGTFNELAANYGFTYDLRNRAFMPSSGGITSFSQSLPVYADKSFITNTFSHSAYKTFTENVVGAGKLYISAINGLGSDDVRLSKRRNLSGKRLRGFEKGKVGPIDGNDHVGGNYAAALSFEANLPNVFPENTNIDAGTFLDFGSVWGVDYDKNIDDSNELRSTFGATLNWISPLGPMSFVFSQNLSKADTDKTESFRFNLGTTF